MAGVRSDMGDHISDTGVPSGLCPAGVVPLLVVIGSPHVVLWGPVRPDLGGASAKREDLRGLHERMSRISARMTAPRKVVSVTVGWQEDVIEPVFPCSVCRSTLAGARLPEPAAMVLEIVRAARAKVGEELAVMMAPMMPSGFAVRALPAGKAYLDRILPDEPSLDGGSPWPPWPLSIPVSSPRVREREQPRLEWRYERRERYQALSSATVRPGERSGTIAVAGVRLGQSSHADTPWAEKFVA